jgi:hypothetical protein
LGFGLKPIGDASSPVYIVALREILPEMTTAAFFTPERCSRDQQADGHETGDTPQLSITGGCGAGP